MNSKKLFLAFFAIISIYLPLKSQNLSFGLSANAGLGISHSTDISPLLIMDPTISLENFSSTHEFDYGFSFNIGLLAKYEIPKNFYTITGLEWSKFSYSETKTLYYIYQNTDYISPTRTEVTTNAINLPILIGKDFGKFGVRLGVQSGIIFSVDTKAFNYAGERVSSNVLIGKKVDLAPRIGLQYTVNNELSIHVDAFHGLIDKNMLYSGKDRNRYLGTGINYFFIK